MTDDPHLKIYHAEKGWVKKYSLLIRIILFCVINKDEENSLSLPLLSFPGDFNS